MVYLEKTKVRNIINLVAFIEVAIGTATMSGLTASIVFALPKKPINIFMFVFISAVISTSLGVGLFLKKNWPRRLLIFFSGWVILTKMLVFMGILHFSGELLVVVSNPVKNAFSIAYHSIIVFLLNQKAFKGYFLKEKGHLAK